MKIGVITDGYVNANGTLDYLKILLRGFCSRKDTEVCLFFTSENQRKLVSFPIWVRKITSKTKAIVVVHLYGHPCDMDAIMKIAKEHNLYVIEDCAEAIGSEYKDKKGGVNFSILQVLSMQM